MLCDTTHFNICFNNSIHTKRTSAAIRDPRLHTVPGSAALSATWTEADARGATSEIGEENFAGLEALADCKHDQSLGAADKGRQSNNPNYALAGLWLEILSYADQGQEAQARALFPVLVKQDWNIDTTTQAETRMREGTTALGNIREEYGRARVCAT